MLRTSLTTLTCFWALSSVPLAQAAAPAEHVILVSIDGWAHHYFDDPSCHMPAVKALAAAGVHAKRMECSFPTVTWTNHTTLVTGVSPAKHGVIANGIFDPRNGRKFRICRIHFLIRTRSSRRRPFMTW